MNTWTDRSARIFPEGGRGGVGWKEGMHDEWNEAVYFLEDFLFFHELRKEGLSP